MRRRPSHRARRQRRPGDHVPPRREIAGVDVPLRVITDSLAGHAAISPTPDTARQDSTRHSSRQLIRCRKMWRRFRAGFRLDAIPGWSQIPRAGVSRSIVKGPYQSHRVSGRFKVLLLAAAVEAQGEAGIQLQATAQVPRPRFPVQRRSREACERRDCAPRQLYPVADAALQPHRRR